MVEKKERVSREQWFTAAVYPDHSSVHSVCACAISFGKDFTYCPTYKETLFTCVLQFIPQERACGISFLNYVRNSNPSKRLTTFIRHNIRSLNTGEKNETNSRKKKMKSPCLNLLRSRKEN